MDIVLERIRNEAPLDPHPRLALVPEPLVAQGGLEDVIVVRVVAELHVAPEVPREALFVHDARREPARGRGRLEEAEVVEAELLEPMSGAKPCRSRPENENPAGIVGQCHRRLRARSATARVCPNARSAAFQRRHLTIETVPVRRPR